MNTFKTFSNDSSNSQQVRPFGSPVSTRSWTIFLSSQNNGLLSIDQIFIGNIKNGSLFSTGNMNCGGSSFRHHFINESSVCKSSSRHHFIITSSRSIGIKVNWFHSFGLKEFWSRRFKGDFSSRGNMVSGNGIS